MKLSLILPGLADVLADSHMPMAFSKWFARSTLLQSTCYCYEQSLLHALGHRQTELAALPGAQCSFLMDFDETAPVLCARADPVHLKAERDDARLIPIQSLELNTSDAEDICKALNEHFAEDGVQFLRGEKGRWYVTGVEGDAAALLPSSQVAGRSVSAFMPSSVQTRRWRQLSTEVQMLLHSLDVNERRSQRGLLPINALWFWGNAKLQSVNGLGNVKLYANSAFALGLAKLKGITTYPLEEIGDSLSMLKARSADALPGAQSNTKYIVLDTRLLENILIGDRDSQRHVLTDQQHLLSQTRLRRRAQIRDYATFINANMEEKFCARETSVYYVIKIYDDRIHRSTFSCRSRARIIKTIRTLTCQSIDCPIACSKRC